MSEPLAGGPVVGAQDGEGPSGQEPPSVARAQRRRMLSALIKVLAVVIAVAALVFCVVALAKEWHNLGEALEDANWGLLILAYVCGAAGMVGLALMWRELLHEFGATAPHVGAVFWFFTGEMAKYIPGGLWPVLGRGELARRAGARRSVAYTTVILSLGFMCVGGAVMCGLLAPFVSFRHGGSWEWLLLLLIPAGLIGVHPAVLGRIFRIMNKVTKGRFEVSTVSWGRMILLILRAVPTWFFISASAICVTAALHLSFSFPAIALAATSGWIIGFLALPVPAGAGVRELVFIAVSGLVSSHAVVVATVFRMVFIVVDLTGGLSGLVLIRLRRSWKVRSDASPSTRT